MAQGNYNLKLTLSEADSVKRALQDYCDKLDKLITSSVESELPETVIQERDNVLRIMRSL